MKHVHLKRLIESPYGTFGRMRLDGHEWYTVERKSSGEFPCIPAGEYKLGLGMFYGGDGPGGLKPDYPAYEIVSVPGRSQIKIHVANLASEIRGCIAPGKGLGIVNNAWAVVQSQTAFREFMEAMNGEPGVISIEGV